MESQTPGSVTARPAPAGISHAEDQIAAPTGRTSTCSEPMASGSPRLRMEASVRLHFSALDTRFHPTLRPPKGGGVPLTKGDVDTVSRAT